MYLNEWFMRNVWVHKQNHNSLFGKKYLKPNEK